MEEHQESSLAELTQITLSEEGKSQLASVGRWTQILSWVGFILAIYFFSTGMMAVFGITFSGIGAAGGFLPSLILSFFIFAIAVNLFSCSKDIREGMKEYNQEKVNSSFRHLHSSLRIGGVGLLILTALFVGTRLFLIITTMVLN